ncbi:hypothetical protein [Paludibacter jiangxiensis]|uniref:Uncharacterized protein n=1 Tax=Paludibacter jiangxiensis TaxID=681398 RepID=A0A161L9U4_9BACT|nr:hypothetical protein [Paludibacter jiangxiensis]GAT64364.1 hypothetical protein PJIAN_4915 [Paludibacter jiangxiensis]
MNSTSKTHELLRTAFDFMLSKANVNVLTFDESKIMGQIIDVHFNTLEKDTATITINSNVIDMFNVKEITAE